MTLEEVKQELRVFDKFTFFEEGHYYKCNNKYVYLPQKYIYQIPLTFA